MPATNSNRRAVLLSAAILVLAGFAAYHNIFRVPFLFDDEPSIIDNPTIQHLWPLTVPLSPPRDFGVTVSGRPVVNLTLAVNQAISGNEVWSYHALNLVIHLLAGLTLFGIIRRTLLRPILRERFGSHATALALAIALLWTLHPLQTESVTYVIQRTESLMGLFYLLTLYCFIRSVDDAPSWPWEVLAVISCLLGMASKEVMVTAPVLVLLYDRTFIAGSFREAWRARRGAHLRLAATWLLLAYLVLGTGGDRGGTFKFSVGLFGKHLLTQFEAIARYLWLSVWPHPLSFEYGVHWPNGAGEWLPYACIVAVAAVSTAVALWRWPIAGFLGCWFFAILAPTSLLPATFQLIVEHRMYLPLAAVIALVMGSAYAEFGPRVLPICFVLALGAGVLTAARNADYATDLLLWTDTVARSPGSARAHGNLGKALFDRGQTVQAIGHYQRAIELDPDLPQAQFNLGLALEQSGQLGEAAEHYTAAARINPRLFQAEFKAGSVLARLGRYPEAAECFQQSLQTNPDFADAHVGLGAALVEEGRSREAVEQFAEAVRLKPDDAAAEGNWGAALFRLGQLPDAAAHLERALRLDPRLADAHFNLGLVFAQLGQEAEAVVHYAAAVRLDPAQAGAQLNLGIAEAREGQLAEAIPHLQAAVQLKPDWPEAHGNLGAALDESGRVTEAAAQYEEALRLKPDYPTARSNLLRLRQLRSMAKP